MAAITTELSQEHVDQLTSQFIHWEQASRDTIDFKKAYVDMAGDLVAGLVLSQIVYWHLPGRNGVTKLTVSHDGQLWIAKKREEWWDEVRVTPKQLDRALRILEKRGLVVTALYHFNSKPTKHVRLNWSGFITNFQASISPKSQNEPDPILTKGKNRQSSNLTKGENAISPKVKILYNREYSQRIPNTVATSPDGESLATAGADGSSRSLANQSVAPDTTMQQVNKALADLPSNLQSSDNSTVQEKNLTTPLPTAPSDPLPIVPPPNPLDGFAGLRDLLADPPESALETLTRLYAIKRWAQQSKGLSVIELHLRGLNVDALGPVDARRELEAITSRLAGASTPPNTVEANPIALDAKQTPSSLNSKQKPKAERPRDPVFDAIALGSYGMVKAPHGKGGYVGSVLAPGVKECTPPEHLPTLAADLKAMYAWYKIAHPELGSAPAKVETICKYLAEWRQAKNKPAQPSDQQWMPRMV